MAIILLSKETFSGAGELARRASEKMGYNLVSREQIIDKTAGYGVSQRRRDRARRRHLGLLSRVDRKWMHYLIYARATLTKEIQEGNLIYLGDNGPTLLQGFPNLVSVKVVASTEHRVDALTRLSDYVISRKKARRVIEKIDDKRSDWSRALFDGSGHDSSEFDLVVELGRISLSDACALIQTTAEGPHLHPTKNLWKQSSY